jgi:signal transduction histidine kinase
MMPVLRRRAGRTARPRWPRRTARLRLTALYGGLFLLSGAALVAVTYALFERLTEYRAPRLPAIPHAPTIQHVDLQAPFTRALPQLRNAQMVFTNDLHQLARQYAAAALGTGPLKGPVPLLSRDQRELARDRHQLARAVHQLAQAVHQIAQAGSVEGAQRAADSHQLLVDSGIALAIVAVVALLSGWLIAGRVLRPIRTITGKARRISSASLHERLALEGPEDELKELGRTLDDLFGRLEAAFEAQRHFVANASHELRTPLTAERSLLQVALDDPDTSAETWRATARELLASNDEQSHLIEALLTLASSEGGLDHREPVDLSVVVKTVLLDRCDPGRHGLQIVTTTSAAPLEGDPRLLESLVTNLVDNAIAYNVEGGRVDVSTGAQDGRTWLAVSNTGPDIPPTDVDRLFEPFQRLDRRRVHHGHGHGLGLSIVRAIASAHGATINAQPLPHGGISIEVSFPLPAQPREDALGGAVLALTD